MAITPGGRVGDASPLAKHPGGPRRLDDYVREVAHALIREHGYPIGEAIAIARSSLKKWAAGGSSGRQRGHVHPQVQAGAAAALIHQKILDHSRRKAAA